MRNNYRFPFKLLLILLCLFIYGYTILSLYRIILTLAPDFSVFYQSAKNLISGRNPYQDQTLYTGLGYPPVTLIFFLPLVQLPYKFSQGLFVISSALSVILIVYLSLLLTGKKVSFPDLVIFSALCFLMFPVKFTLGMGQSNLIVYLIVLLGYYFSTRKKPLLAGVLIGISIIIKPLLGLLLVYYFFKREWLTLNTALIMVIFFLLISIAFWGMSLYRYYLVSVLPPLFNLNNREIYYNQGIIGFISRLSPDLLFRKITGLILSLTVFGFTIRSLIKTQHRNLNFAIVLVMILLVDSLSWQHHFVFLIFPFIVLLQLIKQTNKKNLLTGLLLAAYILVSTNIKNPLTLKDWPYRLILSHVFYGTVILFILILNFSLYKVSEK